MGFADDFILGFGFPYFYYAIDVIEVIARAIGETFFTSMQHQFVSMMFLSRSFKIFTQTLVKTVYF